MGPRRVIPRSDVRIEKFRARGPGGQKKNKTESAVRIVHIPTGVAVTCCDERTYTQNLEGAWAALHGRLDRIDVDRREAAKRAAYLAKPDAAFGEHIRTYRLVGKDMGVVDHRTGHAERDVRSVLAGGIDGLIRSNLLAARS